MANEFDPVVENWYLHLDKGQRFEVVAVDEERGVVELQHYDGDVEEVSRDEWAEMDIELSEAPQNWSGSVDVVEIDDLGTEVTDTSEDDWSESLGEFGEAAQERIEKGEPSGNQ
jgi:hypothetical protein